MYIFYLIVSLAASIIGAICGIGGGIIIKPVLDAFSYENIATVSFLSSCTVFSMSLYTVIREFISGDSNVNVKTSTPLAVGAAIGGVSGKYLFAFVNDMFKSTSFVGAIQAGSLLVITAATLIYTILKNHIKTKNIKNVVICIFIGLLLGLMSSFIGIGGGPINLVFLFYFFSIDTKKATQNSLYIILISQAANLLTTIVTNSVPAFNLPSLVFMILGGILGGIIGKIINKKISENTVNKLFTMLLILIICINMYNIFNFI